MVASVASTSLVTNSPAMWSAQIFSSCGAVMAAPPVTAWSRPLAAPRLWYGVRDGGGPAIGPGSAAGYPNIKRIAVQGRELRNDVRRAVRRLRRLEPARAADDPGPGAAERF